MDLRTGWPGLADAPWAWPFDPSAAPTGPAAGGPSTPVSPPIPTAGSRLTVVRTTDLTKQGNLHSQLVALMLNSFIMRGEMTYTDDPDPTRRWALDPTASPFWPGGLTARGNAPGTYGTFT